MTPLLGQHNSRAYRCDSIVFGTTALGSFGTAAYQIAQLCLGASSQGWWAAGALTTTCAISIFGFIRAEQHKKASVSSLEDVRVVTPPSDVSPEKLTQEVDTIYTALNLDQIDHPATQSIELSTPDTLQKLRAIHAHHQRVAEQLRETSQLLGTQTSLDPIEMGSPNNSSTSPLVLDLA